MLVSFSTTRKFGLRFLLSSPIPPSRKPVHVSSSPITAINFPRPAITEFQTVSFNEKRRKNNVASSWQMLQITWIGQMTDTSALVKEKGSVRIYILMRCTIHKTKLKCINISSSFNKWRFKNRITNYNFRVFLCLVLWFSTAPECRCGHVNHLRERRKCGGAAAYKRRRKEDGEFWWF